MELSSERAQKVFLGTLRLITSPPPYSPTGDECSFILGIIFGELNFENKNYRIFVSDFGEVVKYINKEIPSFNLSAEIRQTIEDVSKNYITVDPDLTSLISSYQKVIDSVRED